MIITCQYCSVNTAGQHEALCPVVLANELRQTIIDQAPSLFAELQQVKAQRDALLADAERYRWLRDVGDETWVPLGKRPGVQFTHEIDAAIDAARKSNE